MVAALGAIARASTLLYTSPQSLPHKFASVGAGGSAQSLYFGFYFRGAKKTRRSFLEARSRDVRSVELLVLGPRNKGLALARVDRVVEREDPQLVRSGTVE